MFEERTEDNPSSGALSDYSSLSDKGLIEKVSDNTYKIASEDLSKLTLYAEKNGASSEKINLETLVDSENIQIAYDWVTVPSFVLSADDAPSSLSQNLGFESTEDGTGFKVTEGSIVGFYKANEIIQWRMNYSYILSPSFPEGELWMSYLSDDGERVSKKVSRPQNTAVLTDVDAAKEPKLYVKTDSLNGPEKSIDPTNLLIRHMDMDGRLDAPSDTDTFNGVSVSLTQTLAPSSGASIVTIYPDENQEYYLIAKYTARDMLSEETVSTARGRIKAFTDNQWKNPFDFPVEYLGDKNYAAYGELVKIGPIPDTYFSMNLGVKIINVNDLNFIVYSDDPPYVDNYGTPISWLLYDSTKDVGCEIRISDTPKTQESEVVQNE